MNDLTIIELYHKRSEQALVQAQSAYGAACRAVARSVLGTNEDAEECVNDALLRSWLSIPPARPADLRLYLLRLTRNCALDRYRAGRAEKRGGGELPAILDELGECLAAPDGVEDAVDAQELAALIRRFVRALPAREGDLFVRRYFFSESTAEIAERFGLTAHHVTVQLGRTRRKLRKELEREGFLP